jgi:putative transposase
MSDYRRFRVPGGTYFFTLVTYRRRRLLQDEAAVSRLREAILSVQADRAFVIDAAVVLPDHLHLLMTLPPGDDAFPARIGAIKGRFTKALQAKRSAVASRAAHREADVWHRRFWEHAVRNEAEFAGLADYIHWNPVKHGHARCPHAWPHTSFHAWVRRGWLEPRWGCSCERPCPPLANDYDGLTGE